MPTYQTVQRILETEKGTVSMLICGTPFAIGKYRRLTLAPYSLEIREGAYRGLCIGAFVDPESDKKKGLYMAEYDLAGMHYILVGETLREIKKTIGEFFREMGIDA